MSSSDPAGTRALGAELAPRGVSLVDAPVSGGVPRAVNGTLAIMIGADTMNFYIDGDLVKSWTNTPHAPITLATPINFVIGQDLPTDKYLLFSLSNKAS